MRVTDIVVEVDRAEPSERPIEDAIQALPGVGRVALVARTDNDVSGRGEVFFGRIRGAPDTLAALVENELKPLVLGTDPHFVRRTHQALLRETEYHGSCGIAMFGIAATDIALWDCLGKAYGVPCWKLWGAVHDRIPAYAMVGWLNYTDDEVCRICEEAVEQGFHAVKVKVGFPTIEEDIHRVEIVRDAIGDNADLMVDANQSLTVKEAMRRGRAFEELGCLWWEEPIRADNIDGYAALAADLAIPVATGENLYTRADFARFLRRGAVDIIQPDLRRAGGATSLLQIGAMADAFHTPYASHGGGPVQLNVMACLPNAMYLETGLISEDSPMELVDGCVPIPHGPGFDWQ